jgi:hypothetical protein
MELGGMNPSEKSLGSDRPASAILSQSDQSRRMQRFGCIADVFLR